MSQRLAPVCAITFLLAAAGCGLEPPNRTDYRQDMRDFVQAISTYAKEINPEFAVVPQNGCELVSSTGEETGVPDQAYLGAIDAIGREDLFYGYNVDNHPTPVGERRYMQSFLDTALAHGITILITDYCSSPSYVDDSYTQNAGAGYVSFAADHRGLDDIPAYPAAPFRENSDSIGSIDQAKNFLYILDPSSFGSKQAYLEAMRATSFDCLIIDLFFEEVQLTVQEVASLKIKRKGGTRQVLCYVSIGEAESYRYYWRSGWKPGNPGFLDNENPDWEGNYKVRYWETEWQQIIFGDNQSYLKRVLDAGFDGVYLDIIDAFEYFEEEYGE